MLARTRGHTTLGWALLLGLGCRSRIEVEHASLAWTSRPARACPSVSPRGAVELSYRLISASGCTSARPCLLLQGPRVSQLEYVELSLDGEGPRVERTQTLALRPGSIRGTAGATIRGEELVISSGGLGAMTLTLARLGTDGELQWQSALPIPESRWQRPLVLGDEVAVLAEGVTVTLHFVDRRGTPRREVALGETSALWLDGCLLRAGDRLFAAWVGDANYGDGQDRGTALHTAWISVATGEVLRGRTQQAEGLGHQLACARRDTDVAVLVLDGRGTIHSTIMGADSDFDGPLTLVAKLDGTYDFWRPQLVADGDGFAAAWDAVPREDERMRPRGFVSYLDREGRRTRIVELGSSARDVRLIPGSSGVTAVYWSGGRRLSAAEVDCGGAGRPGP
ncbi:MAG: hypothetical protein R3B09_09540 [Nannocystaceae bacterium]